MKNNNLQEIITFKVDSTMQEAMKDIPNRSDFIRSAVLAALDNTCPLCKGSGELMPNQKKHWNSFMSAHRQENCEKCNAIRFVCEKPPKRKKRAHA
jgi:hypothetical protein